MDIKFESIENLSCVTHLEIIQFLRSIILQSSGPTIPYPNLHILAESLVKFKKGEISL